MNSPITTPMSANDTDGVREAKVQASAAGTITVRITWRSEAPRKRAEYRSRRSS